MVLPVGYEARFYRDWIGPDAASGLRTFRVVLRETDLLIRARRDLAPQARRLVEDVRKDIETWAATHPEFLTSLWPLPIPPDARGAPLAMLKAARAYDVGPMAAVAGAVADEVGRGLLRYTPEVVVENGGDIFVQLGRPAVLALYSGPASPFTRRILLEVGGAGRPFGVCTSSATVGHSVSFGRADAVVCVADTAALADAAATALCNRIRRPEDIEGVIEGERARGLLRGVLAVMGRALGVWGEIALHAGEAGKDDG